MKLDTQRLQTLDQVREFLAGSRPLDLQPETRAEAYAFVAETLVHHPPVSTVPAADQPRRLVEDRRAPTDLNAERSKASVAHMSVLQTNGLTIVKSSTRRPD